MFLLHGVATLFGPFTPHGESTPVGQWPSWWAGLIQFVGGGLVLLGLFTRPAALVCSGAMAFAYFKVHQPRGLFPIQNAGELAAMYSWTFLLIAALGAGPFALDALIRQRRRAPEPDPRPAPAKDEEHSRSPAVRGSAPWRCDRATEGVAGTRREEVQPWNPTPLVPFSRGSPRVRRGRMGGP
ncbi:DoxX family protein [Saccharopolyspora spinosporotrichia]